MDRTIGFDFGTHQTKLCVEEKSDTGTSYQFFPFADAKGNVSYLLPSVVRINQNNTLSYGVIDNRPGKIVRYFKQATYCTGEFTWNYEIRAEYFSIWYLAYILFHLEYKYGVEFRTNMGVPTDTASLNSNKQRAVSIMLSAFRLVEEVFKNDLDAFLRCKVEELFEKTEIVPSSEKLKDNYGILVFPEAYACLRPLTARRKLSLGMSLMVDIGGGTTDMSFFTIEKGNAQIYRFISIAKGLNYLSGVDGDASNSKDPAAIKESDLNQSRRSQYSGAVAGRIQSLISDLYEEFAKACKLDKSRLDKALTQRPIVFTGGGSTFPILRQAYETFTDIYQVSVETWNINCFPEFADTGLCPILNTAYGLSISTGATNDDIAITPFDTIFEGLKGANDNPNPQPRINLRDGTVDTTGCDIKTSEHPVVWKLIHPVTTETRNARSVEVSDSIQRVRSSDISISNYLAHKGQERVAYKPFTVKHAKEDVEEFLLLNFEIHLPIPDRLRDSYAANIPDANVRADFIRSCKELNEECKQYERNREKDNKFRKKQKIKSKIQPVSMPKRQFSIGDLIDFLDEEGGGKVVSISIDGFIAVEDEHGLVHPMLWSQCLLHENHVYFPDEEKSEEDPTPSKPGKPKEEKNKERVNGLDPDKVADLLNLFGSNKKKK